MKDPVKNFESVVLRPLNILFVLPAIYFLMQGKWLPFIGCDSAMLFICHIGANLHPIQSARDLARGPLTNPMAELESQLYTPQQKKLLAGRACMKVGILVGLTIGVICWTILGWRWYFAIPAAWVTIVSTGGFLTFFFSFRHCDDADSQMSISKSESQQNESTKQPSQKLKNINDPIPIKYPNHPQAQKLYESQVKLNRTTNLLNKIGYSAPQSPEPNPQSPPKNIIKQHRVLIVAEWDGLGDFLSNFLTDNDFKVTVIETNFDSEKIISELSRGTYAVVILTDNGLLPKQLPDMVSEVKNKHPETYRIVLAWAHEKDFMKELWKRGPDAFLSMPFKTEDLLREIKKAIQLLRERKMKLPYFEEAGLYEVPDDLLEQFCRDNDLDEGAMYELLPNPSTGLPMILGLHPIQSHRQKVEKMFENSLSLEELREYKDPKERLFVALDILWSLKDEIRALG